MLSVAALAIITVLITVSGLHVPDKTERTV